MSFQVGIVVLSLCEGDASAVVLNNGLVVAQLVCHLAVHVDGGEVFLPVIVQRIHLETVVEHVACQSLTAHGEGYLAAALELNGHHVLDGLGTLAGIKLQVEGDTLANGNLGACGDRAFEIVGAEAYALHLQGTLTLVQHGELVARVNGLAEVDLAGIPTLLVEYGHIVYVTVDHDVVKSCLTGLVGEAGVNPAELYLLTCIFSQVDGLVAPVFLTVCTFDGVLRQV